jgi:hypothetical protein
MVGILDAGVAVLAVEVEVEVVVEVEAAVVEGPLAMGFTEFEISGLRVTRNCLASEACPFNSLPLMVCSALLPA